MVTTMPTRVSDMLSRRTMLPLNTSLTTCVSLTRRLIRSPASCSSKNLSERDWMRSRIWVRMVSSTFCPATVIR